MTTLINEKPTPVSFRPPEDIKLGLEVLAKKQCRSVNSQLVVIVRDCLERELGEDWKRELA